MRHNTTWVLAAIALCWSTSAFAAPTDAEKCEAYKIRGAGWYSFCRMKAESKAVRRGTAPAFAWCAQKIVRKFEGAEARWAAECTTLGDVGDIQDQITMDTDVLVAQLAGRSAPQCGFPPTGQTTTYGSGDDGEVQAGGVLSYTDNGDGTITDNNTMLIWEVKDENNAGSVHKGGNGYTWTNGTTAFDGTVVTVFLAKLNNYCDDDEATACTTDADCVGAPNIYASNDLCGHAGYRDWRLPNVKELQSIVGYELPCTG